MIPTQTACASAVIVGGGPAGLMAADVLSRAGVTVDLYDAMPSLGRKFLMAGKGGMNITHSEPDAAFRARYGDREKHIAPMLDAFGPNDVRTWMLDLGIDSFVGTSGRVFPVGMKAAPLLRAWLHRLRASGVRIHTRHRWCGFAAHAPDQARLTFATPEGERVVTAATVILALGGGSWPKLGSDGRWVAPLESIGVPVAPLRPANCGFDLPWSAVMLERHAGQPVKNVVATTNDARGTAVRRRGEFIVTETGVEGGLVYALSAPLREAIEQSGSALLALDLLPGHDARRVLEEVARPRGSRSMSSHLQSRLGIKGVKMALLRECLARDAFADPASLAAGIKALPLRLVAPRPLDEAISTAGGVRFSALGPQLMVDKHPGLFCAGEMLDWEAPTGGYLLTACLASGYVAGQGALAWLQSRRQRNDDQPRPTDQST